MKKILLLCILTLLALNVSAQNYSYTEFKNAFEDFSETLAAALPFNSLIGLNWSDAYIGNFPHFGAGLTVGLTTIPVAGLKSTLDTLNLGSDQFEILPVPAAMAEGRIGGFVLPFDIGVKFGMLPPGFSIPVQNGNINIDYLITGFDVRFAVLKGMLLIPTISIGGGLNYLNAGISIPGILNGDVNLTEVGGQDLVLKDPDIAFGWETLTIDAKAQASWSLLILNAYLGAGATYGLIAKAGGGMESEIYLGANKITNEEIAAIEAITGQVLDINADGIKYMASISAPFSMRVFGGLSFTLLILKLDLSAMYNVMDSSFGAGLNIRIQL
ncbi:MAG: hypothetical protein JXR70_11075 [Spirochaetales bacterium]|nr:hypothetical protein [Spirochaetales bacterium]